MIRNLAWQDTSAGTHVYMYTYIYTYRERGAVERGGYIFIYLHTHIPHTHEREGYIHAYISFHKHAYTDT